MELDELKSIWTEYDRKLERNLQLNIQLLRKMNMDKVRRSSSALLAIKLIEVALYGVVMAYMLGFTAKYISQPQFGIPAVLLVAAMAIALFTTIKQLGIIYQLRKHADAAIAPLQKKAETLKLKIAHFVKYMFLAIPAYPLLLLLAGKIFLNVDFTAKAHLTYFLSNVGVALATLPLVIWFYRELSKREIKKQWVKNLLVGSGWHQAQAAGDFLEEIEKFEAPSAP